MNDIFFVLILLGFSILLCIMHLNGLLALILNIIACRVKNAESVCKMQSEKQVDGCRLFIGSN